jgi:alkanesulfonate monooxygenase SsuD/methylene tetrahydromethanopterin reductase-like flavin-dependent oxidoreductase (luciferase family)
MTWREPVDRMRGTLVAVRALLDGARLPLEREGIRPLRLGSPPDGHIAIYLAALAPASVRLAGELADRWLPFLWARSRLPDGRALLAEGEAAAEAPTATRVSASVPLAIAEDEDMARQIAAGWLLAYLTRMGPPSSKPTMGAGRRACRRQPSRWPGTSPSWEPSRRRRTWFGSGSRRALTASTSSCRSACRKRS